MTYGQTGHCQWGRHARCWHTQNPQGLVRADGTTWHCTCPCHTGGGTATRKERTVANITLSNGQTVDERKLLGLPTGADRGTGKQLAAAMKAAGYKVLARDTRDQLLVKVAEGTFKARQQLRTELRTLLGIDLDTPAKGETAKNGAASQPKELGVGDMMVAIRKKGYQGTLPRAKAEMQTVYDSIVGQGVIPHTYETGTKLQDVVERPWTELAVTPEPHQPVRRVVLTAVGPDHAAGVRRIAQKANRAGMLVRLGEVTQSAADQPWEAEVLLVPKDPTDDDDMAVNVLGLQ